MKLLKTSLMLATVSAIAISFSSCKAKKPVTQAPSAVKIPERPVEEKINQTPLIEAPKPAPVAMEKANFNFKNIQFEFNSAVLKTFSYEVLDKIATEMKKSESAKFEISGHSSAEGTEEHNKSLSVDRANSVKTYLVNAGINAANLSTVGYGESKPLTENTTESGRALNRRVEIKRTN